MTRLLAELDERADLLLIDTPPVLPVSDALALSPRVDAVLVVTRLGEIRRSALNELARLLDAAPIVKLGFIVTGAGVRRGPGIRWIRLWLRVWLRVWRGR